MNQTELDHQRLDLTLKAKNGIDFIVSATVTWLIIGYIWTLDTSSYNKSVLTFIAGGILLPLAFVLSKLFKTHWKLPNNPIQPLGLWLNFAQLFYFPFLIFILLSDPDYFVMTYAIITGAHLFPYAWFYHEKAYAVMAGIISIGAMLLGLNLPLEKMFLIPVYVCGGLVVLATWIFLTYRKKTSNQKPH